MDPDFNDQNLSYAKDILTAAEEKKKCQLCVHAILAKHMPKSPKTLSFPVFPATKCACLSRKYRWYKPNHASLHPLRCSLLDGPLRLPSW